MLCIRAENVAVAFETYKWLRAAAYPDEPIKGVWVWYDGGEFCFETSDEIESGTWRWKWQPSQMN